MKEYLDVVRDVLHNGQRKENRTGVATLSSFAKFYRVSLQNGYPLLTTKKMFFKSMLHETFWYLTGEEHIRSLREHTKIWDAWATPEGNLETAYGRFWRRYPVPEKGLQGENWGERWVTTAPDGTKTFDQIQYIIDSLKEIKKNPSHPNLRRLVVVAWHPANAAQSLLPPCHYTFAFNVAGDKLNCHLTQRSADLALGVPFNLACYSLLTMMIAKETGYTPGEFAHTMIDAHIYENQIEGLKEQLTRTPKALPQLRIADKPFNELTAADITLEGYDPDPVIKFPGGGMIAIIGALTQDYVIGKGNRLIWDIPEDLQHFKNTTKNQIVVMGRKTYESIGRPLPDRINIVVSTTMQDVEGLIIVRTLQDAIDSAKQFDKEIYLIGGAQIFEEGLQYADQLILSWVKKRHEGDVHFPRFNQSEWEITKEEPFDEFTIKWYVKRKL